MLVQLNDPDNLTVRLYFEHKLVPRLGRYRCRTIREDVLCDMEFELAAFEKTGVKSKQRYFLETQLRTSETTAFLEYVAAVDADGKRTWKMLHQATVHKFVGDAPSKRAAAQFAFHALMKDAPLSPEGKAAVAKAFLDARGKRPSMADLKREIARLKSEPTGVTRFEVIDHRGPDPVNGRALTVYDCKVTLSYQDGGRTLKVFLDGERPAPMLPAHGYGGHAVPGAE